MFSDKVAKPNQINLVIFNEEYFYFFLKSMKRMR